ncbi:class III poly(R)-hydroxyalkanoic acid synthase subunit PhaC [Motiliproteus sediminis]|uniref:class III poly(R)-hydroxyalkanoic acid synthase subunit PhaC n=1 Tax=Motiliproteus sediminis TaxID=1468178 RepID=UPI001AF01B6C|nr:class III poly(R)-hydroxyalkanoic acid synthase subunit PhaC [Motiliproteus sediminis]
MKQLFQPEKLITEMLNLSREAVEGMQTLGKMDGVEVDTTPWESIYQQDKLRLRYYAPSQPRLKTPLLIVYALVNRPYILDLQPDRSLIAALLQRGIPVYLIDWGYPDHADRFIDLDDYLNDYLHQCVRQVCQHAGTPQTNLLGVCQGGTFSLCYSAIHPQQIRNLITLVTPVDFHTADNTLSGLARDVDAQLALDTYGNFPGSLMTRAYNSLMPMRLGLHKELNLPRQLNQHQTAANYLRMERWINDSPDLAGSAFKEFLQQFFQQNRLVTGGLTIGSHSVDLQQQQQPLLNLFAAGDHLVPPSASQALAKLTGSKDYTEKEYPGGHIGVFVGRQAQKVLPDDISNWLKQRD